MANMFIRKTRTNSNNTTGEGYFTFRLVRGERIAGKVRQITVLNLGRHFPIAQADWPLLCSRLEQLLNPQTLLCTLECSDKIERTAQIYFNQLVDRAKQSSSTKDEAAAPTQSATGDSSSADTAGVPPPSTPMAAPAPAVAPDIQSVDIDSLALSQARNVGLEHVALHAIAQLGLEKKFTELGISAVGRACILGNLIGRMAAPASELATWEWLQSNSALGELLAACRTQAFKNRISSEAA